MTRAYFRPDSCLVERLGESSGGDQSAMHSNALKEHKKNEGMIEPAAVFPVTDHPPLSRPGANEKIGRVREWSVGGLGGFVCHATSFLWLREAIILFCTKIVVMPLLVIRIVLP